MRNMLARPPQNPCIKPQTCTRQTLPSCVLLFIRPLTCLQHFLIVGDAQVAKSRQEKALGLATSRQMRKLQKYDHHVKFLVGNAAQLITPEILALGLYIVKSIKKNATKTYSVCVALGTCSCKWVNSVQVCKHLEAVSVVHFSLATTLDMLQQPFPDVPMCSAWSHLLRFGALHAGAATLDVGHLRDLRLKVRNDNQHGVS